MRGALGARCMRSMFGHHDKQAVFVLGFPLAPSDDSPERADIRQVCDSWVEGSNLTDAQARARRASAPAAPPRCSLNERGGGAQAAAELSRQQVHILVDTTGYTMKQRPEAGLPVPQCVRARRASLRTAGAGAPRQPANCGSRRAAPACAVWERARPQQRFQGVRRGVRAPVRPAVSPPRGTGRSWRWRGCRSP
jgi:hypothetical protein